MTLVSPIVSPASISSLLNYQKKLKELDGLVWALQHPLRISSCTALSLISHAGLPRVAVRAQNQLFSCMTVAAQK